jgi:multiple sugar transport system permease protein
MSDNKKTKEWGTISGSYFIQKKIQDIVYRVCRGVLLFGLCFLILQPLLNKFSLTLMEAQDLNDRTVINIPRHFTFENYIRVSLYMDYFRSLLQTVFIVLTSAVLQTASCALAGYGFARFKFPLKNFWFSCVMLIIIVPPQTIMTSLYLNFRFFDFVGIIRLVSGRPLNLLESFLGLFLLSVTGMGLKSGLYIFMLRQYFRGMPKELEEAAWIDGCGRLKTFIRIMLPDAMPMLTSCFLFSFVWQWTDSFYSSLFLSVYKMLSSALGSISAKFALWYMINISNQGLSDGSVYVPRAEQSQMLATGMLMFILPLVLLYLAAQKAFVESLSQTGIKM